MLGLRKFGLISIKIILWFIGILLLLLVLAYLLIRVPGVQNIVRNKAVSYLEAKLKTKVEINKISLDLPKSLVLEDIYFEDQKQDTLLSGDTLKVDISLLKLLDNQLEINEVDLRGLTLNVKRTTDSVYNFDYILKAFMSEQKKKTAPVDSASTMKFSMDKINLDRIQLRFQDALMAADANIYIGHFDTRIRKFDLEKMKFSIPEIKLSGLNASIIQSKQVARSESPETDSLESSKPFDLDLTLGKISLDKIRFNYINDISGIKSDINIGSLLAELNLLDLRKQNIDLESLALKNSKIDFSLAKKALARVVSKEVGQEVDAVSNNWTLKAGKIDLEKNDIKFVDHNIPKQSRGMDFGNLDIKALNFGLTDLNYSPDSTSGKIRSGSFIEKGSGFSLQDIRSNFVYSPTRIYLNNLYLKTPGSEIRDRIRLDFASILSLTKKPGDLGLDADLKNSRVSFRDILIFVPEMASIDAIKRTPDAILKINGLVKGKVKDLYIPKMEISGFRNTSLKASGRIKGLPDMNKAFFDLHIVELNTRRNDLTAILPPGTIPANIRIPEVVRLKGIFKGGISNFNTNLDLNSSYGSAKTIAGYDSRQTGKEKYQADIRLFNFHIGKLIKQEGQIGRVDLSAKVSGTGIDPKTMNAVFAAKVQHAEYNGYNYRNLTLNGNSKNGNLFAKAKMLDPNLVFDGNIQAGISGKYPSLKLNLDLDSANFQKLNFVSEDLRFHGKIIADLSTADPDFLNGSIILTNAIIARGKERFQLDSVSIISTANAESNTLKLRSEVLNADVSGKYQLTGLGFAMQELVNRYFSTGTISGTKPKSPQIMVFNASLMNGPLLNSLAPQLKELATVTLNGSFNSEKAELLLNVSAPRVIYGTNDLNNLLLNINTGDEALNYSATIGNITTPQLQLQNTTLKGKAQNNILTTDLQVYDREKKPHYHLAGQLRALNPDFVFSLIPDGLMLNYEPWAVADGNEIRFGAKGIQASNFVISNNSQKLSVNTVPPGLNNPLQIAFSNFKIETITSMVKKDSLFIGGTINGNVLASELAISPVFTSDLSIDDFNFRGDTLGLVTLKINNRQENILAANVSIKGKGNDLLLDGNYNLGNSSFDMDLDIKNLNLKSIEGFTFGAINKASGSINGRLGIKGTVEEPKILGGINFNQAAFNLSMLNSYFKVRDNELRFNSDGIVFDKFTLVDSAENTALVNGIIFTKNYTDYRFDLDIEADNFRVMNSTEKDNELYYGKLFLDTKLSVGGTLNSPSVDGILKVNDESVFTVVLPQSNPAIEERQGIVEFIDMDNPELASILSSELDSLNQSSITGMNVSVNLEIDKEAEFNIIIDKANGDLLSLKGEAQLNAGIDPSGKVTLTGTYNLDEGAYELSFNLLKRRFEIEKGSTITWTGEPTTADIKLTAVYTANTAPLDLVDNVLGDAPQSQRNTYKQKLPFEVNLSMKGELLKPEITFDIKLPERNYNVSTDVTGTVNTRLEQLRQEPSELNKQVFALLLLNRFVGDNPFSSSAGGGGAESLARQSVSKILSEQLNNLAGNLIAGFDLNFDLEATDDYTTGQRANRTELNVGLSRRLLNDRLRVNVGSNFELEGPQQPGAKTSNLAGDVSVEYQLSKDGRYLLRAYQKNEYQVAIQGQVIETGIGFILTMDYNKFREIFQTGIKDLKRRRRAESAERKESKENE